MKSANILIIGAGQAGARTALALRELGHIGTITLIGDECEPPYERPPLSKDILGADATCTHLSSHIQLHAPEHYAQLNIELLLGLKVSTLNRQEHTICLSNGSVLSFDRCVLTTGGRAKRWSGELLGNGKRVVTLRTLRDAQHIRHHLQSIRNLIIIGGGFLGLECAHAANTLGISTTVVESCDRLLPERMPAPLSQRLQTRHENNGVQFRLGTSVARIIDTPDVYDPVTPLTVVLENGEQLHAQLCLIAIGQTPNIELAVQAGLETGNGIHVDTQCRSTDPSIFAAGDCASFPFGEDGTRVRIESWHNAEQQSRIAAANVLGLDTHYTPLPWFWTDQGGWNIQFLGLSMGGQALTWIVRHGQAADKSVWLGLQDGKILASITVNSGGDIAPLRTLMTCGAVIAPSLLTDPAVKFSKLAKVASSVPLTHAA